MMPSPMRNAAAHALLALTLSLAAAPALAADCEGTVFADTNANGRRDAGESPLSGQRVSDGVEIVLTDAQGHYRLAQAEGRSTFVIKPAGFDAPRRADGLPDTWHNRQTRPGPALKYGGIPASDAACRDFGLVPRAARKSLRVWVFTDPQVKSRKDVDYYGRDIIADVLARQARDGAADVGMSLGDIVNDDLSLYLDGTAQLTRLGVPWLHVAGNHDLDFDAAQDADSLRTFRRHFGPDTVAWEEDTANFIALDDVIYRSGQSPAYIGGLREDQFAFLERYLATAPRQRLLVIGVHIPFFDATPGKETFRHEDRERLFALLRDFPHVLLLSGHSHNQRHVFHGVDSGWHGVQPLHEYNVGAACGAFWSGVSDAAGIPDTTMSDGTPNGYALLQVDGEGAYRLDWFAARDLGDAGIALSGPHVLRRGAWPGQSVYANVFMARDDARVEYRIDDGEWKPMQRVLQADPRVIAQNVADDAATRLRGYDRAPEATPSQHLWRATLPTDLALGEHRVQVRAFAINARRVVEEGGWTYRLDAAP
jgi:hypothetical protein